jgi:hypothetical protein
MWRQKTFWRDRRRNWCHSIGLVSHFRKPPFSNSKDEPSAHFFSFLFHDLPWFHWLKANCRFKLSPNLQTPYPGRHTHATVNHGHSTAWSTIRLLHVPHSKRIMIWLHSVKQAVLRLYPNLSLPHEWGGWVRDCCFHGLPTICVGNALNGASTDRVALRQT